MAIAPLIIQIRAAGAAALNRASAQMRAFGSRVSSVSRGLFAQTRAVSSVAGAYRDANGLWRNANGTLLTQRHTVTHVTTAFGRLVNALRRVRNAALAAALAIGGPLRRALKAAQDAAFSLARALLRWAAIGSAVVPVVFALANVLANLVPLVTLLAPAAFAAGAALAVLKFGFEGISDALSAGLSGDMEEFREALKKLAPSAQAFVKELVKIAPLWRSLKKEIQQRLFVGLAKDIQALSAATFPTLTRWLTIIASEFNKFFSAVFKGLSTPEAQRQLDTIFAGVTRFIDASLDALKHLGRAFLDIAEVAAPAFGQLGDDIESAAEKFAEWVRKLTEDGTLAKWIEDAKTTFGQLKDIGAEIGRVFAAIFKGTDEGGFLENLRNSIKALADWLESDSGQSVIEFFSDVAKAIANVIVWIQNVVEWFQEGIDILRDLAGSGDEAKNKLTSAFSAIGTAVGNLVGAVRTAVAGINAALSAIKTTVFIDIITRNSVQGVARAIGGGGGGGRITARAHGGPVTAGQPYVVGDGGRPELFVPNQSGRILPRVPTGGGSIVYTGGPPSQVEAVVLTWMNAMIRTGRLKVA